MISESATVLIVEDEQDIRELLAYNLEKEGYGTIQAADGKEEITDKGSVTLAKTAHSYKDGVCTVCGEADPNYTAPDTADRLLLPVSVLLVTSAAGYGILRRKRK